MGLGDVEVLGVVDEQAGPLRIHVRCRASRPPCSGCGGSLWSNGERRVVLVDLPALGRPAVLVWHKRRWRCGKVSCEAGYVSERAQRIAPARALLTCRAARWATRQAGRGRPPAYPAPRSAHHDPSGGQGPPAHRHRGGAGLRVAHRQHVAAALGLSAARR